MANEIALAQVLKDADEIRSAYGFLLMRMAVAADREDAYAVSKREFIAHEAALKRLETALPVLLVSPSDQPQQTLVICERCQMKVPERLATFGIGVRAGKAAWCAACRVPDGPDGLAKRAEVVAMRKARLSAWRPEVNQ